MNKCDAALEVGQIKYLIFFSLLYFLFCKEIIIIIIFLLYNYKIYLNKI